MVNWLRTQRPSPIGVDIGSRTVKLLQLSGDRRSVLEAGRWDLPALTDPAGRLAAIAETIRQARATKRFRGSDAVISLGGQNLFVQNVRVNKAPVSELSKLIQQEAASRLNYPLDEAELRYLMAGEVRQGEQTKRELVLMACQRTKLMEMLRAIEQGGLRPVAVDAEPLSLLRSYSKQFRREEDAQQRLLLVHIGAANTVAIIARGLEVLFVKYLELGGQHLDEALARNLEMGLPEAAAMRRSSGDRKADQQNLELVNSIAEATRPVMEKLLSELSLCIRYHNVTFRGQPFDRMILGGGEASPQLVNLLSARLNLNCELGDPLRTIDASLLPGRKMQWDVATGLALRSTE